MFRAESAYIIAEHKNAAKPSSEYITAAAAAAVSDRRGFYSYGLLEGLVIPQEEQMLQSSEK